MTNELTATNIGVRNQTNTVLTFITFLAMNLSGVQPPPRKQLKETVYAPSPSPDLFAGCYEVASVSPSLIGEDVPLFPNRFELLNVPRAPGTTYFNMRSQDAKGDWKVWEASWSWNPKGKDKIEINWGTGMGGFRGTLKRLGSVGLVGKMKEYCDSHCSYRRRAGTLHVQKISCGPD